METLVIRDIKSLRQYFENRRVLITGHTGFKGSWLLTWLHDYGADITGLALKSTLNKNMYGLINGESLCDSIIGDIRDQNNVRDVVTQLRPEYVFHLAAQPLVRRSYLDPVETITTNVIGTLNLLEALRYFDGQCAVIVVTTDKVYKDLGYKTKFIESDVLGGFDPYSSSKICVEHLVDAYVNSYFSEKNYAQHKKRFATVRAGNVIGGGDRAEDRLIPDFIRSVELGEELTVRNPGYSRPWQYVLEPLTGYLMLASKLLQNKCRGLKSLNFGPLDEDFVTVEEIVKKCQQIMGTGSYQLKLNEEQMKETENLGLDISLAQKTIGWRPIFDSYKAVEETLDWYKNSPSNHLEYTRKKISEYTNI